MFVTLGVFVPISGFKVIPRVSTSHTAQHGGMFSRARRPEAQGGVPHVPEGSLWSVCMGG